MIGAALQFAGSLLAILALIYFAHRLGFSRNAQLEDEDDARERFRLAAGGFEPIAIALDTDGAGAIARDASGRTAVLVPHGAQFVARTLTAEDRVTAADGRLDIRFADPTFELSLAIGKDAECWAT
ncbi:hypothetical protein [Aurantiacibacter aquimixticola]|uniref:Uncharacterized protein n=1 Tax=Aurantiacibacter aquimixticola TaxID=1958945 RepID=A0A419RV64_9SPHN|nr:hypothetical protein [Aurantiacibacter aquimixticola]RJY09675.1 hypothetical protein D6201_10200 [Aurantiacibacter aquimixticola]